MLTPKIKLAVAPDWAIVQVAAALPHVFLSVAVPWPRDRSIVIAPAGSGATKLKRLHVTLATPCDFG
jgi:hypothetical protein